MQVHPAMFMKTKDGRKVQSPLFDRIGALHHRICALLGPAANMENADSSGYVYENKGWRK